MSRTGWCRVALMMSVALATPSAARAQDPPCPAASEQRFEGSLPQNGSREFDINLQPCETLSFSVSTTASQMYGATLRFAVSNNTPTELFVDNWASYGTVTRTIPVNPPWVNPYRGTRGAQGLPVKGVIKTLNWAVTSYTIIMTKSPRPGYNRGGTSFDDAPVGYPGSLYFGSLHPLEPGQFFKIHLEPNEGFSLSGTVMGHPSYGAYWVIDLFNSSRAFVRKMVDGTAYGGPFTYTSSIYVNSANAATDVYLRFKTQYWPLHDFKMAVKPLSTTEITELGFKSDEVITMWPDGPVVDGVEGAFEPTWKRSGNPDYPAAYPFWVRPNLFATVTITPPLHTDPVVAVRAKSGGTVIASRAGVTIPAAGGRIDTLLVTTDLENPLGVKAASYTWDWELSFDDGATWASIGSSGPHRVYWTYDPAYDPPFIGTLGEEFPPLYDEALKRATDALDLTTTDTAVIADKITAKIDELIWYDPGHVVNGHPLNAYTDLEGAVCSDNANLLRGLLRSLGIPATTYYVRGGDQGTHAHWIYKYRPTPTRLGTTYTLRADRSWHDGAGDHPHFTYHAIVSSAGGRYYDPSYGDNYLPGEARVDETLAVPVTGPFNEGPPSLLNLDLNVDFLSGYNVPANSDEGPTCPHDYEQQFAAFVGENVPTLMVAGQTYTVTIRMMNTGWNDWQVGEGYYLNLVSQSGLIWGTSVVDLPASVLPDHIATFTFTVTAPSTPGTYDFQWQMRQLVYGSFGGLTPSLSINVVSQ